MPAGTPSSYSTRNWTGDGGITWSSTDTRADQTITGLAAGVRNGSVTSGSIANGIGNLSFKYKYLFTGSAASLDVKVNGVTVGTVAVPSSQTTTTTATLNNINISGAFTLSLVQTVAGSRVAIDDIAWTGFGVSCTAPVTPASGASFSAVTATGFTVNWTAGSGTNSLVVIRQGGAVTGTPSSGTAYTANTAFGSGQTIAAGEYVVYNNTGNSVAVTGLSAGTTYHVAVFTFNSADNCYNTTAPATGSTATSCLQPTVQVSATSSTPGSTSATINWSGGNGTSSLVRVNTVNSFTSPVDGIVYPASTVYTSGEQTVYAGTGSSVTVSGLTASSTYYVTVYTYNDCGGAPDYLVTGTSVHSFATTAGGSGEPAGYYSAASGLTCSALKTSLFNIITTGMTPKTYGNLWNQYLVSDIKPREVGPGTSIDVIWDIYSDNPAGADPYNFTPGPVASGGQQDNGGAAGSEGILYNREHSVPQSWFGASAASGSVGPESDYFHIYPTDKIVNANRSNFIYGEVSSPSITSMNGSKLGPNTVTGLTGNTAFEPIDAFKGDLARSFFYFVTRYQSNMGAWETLSTEGNLAFDGTTWPSIELPYLQMMISWHNLDPVSQKEIDRNNAGYLFQGNRNPFIDHPEFVNQVWVSGCGLILPVRLTDFTGNFLMNAVQLKWQVGMADGFDRFEVERSTDGGRTFQKAGTVNWLQNADKFSFQDADAALKGDVFYRLKLVDQNGTFTYSKVIRVLVPVSDFTAAFYPNPVTDQLGVIFRKPLTAACSVTITDLSGRKLKTLKLASGQQHYSIPVAELAGGTYLLQLRSEDQLIHTKFIKQ
ncbi:MAG: endonuclease [Sphingobacteriales bacterium]|nr:endonuclease [Sphingobacteriales bacterium]